MASHHSAAQLLRLNLLNTPAQGTVMLTVPPGTRVGNYARTGVVCHMAELPGEHLTKLYGIPTTTPARTAHWPGLAQARQVVEFANGLAESAFESCARVDFFWRRYGVIAEADGLLKYDGGERAIAELKRDRPRRRPGDGSVRAGSPPQAVRR